MWSLEEGGSRMEICVMRSFVVDTVDRILLEWSEGG